MNLEATNFQTIVTTRPCYLLKLRNINLRDSKTADLDVYYNRGIIKSSSKIAS